MLIAKQRFALKKLQDESILQTVPHNEAVTQLLIQQSLAVLESKAKSAIETIASWGVRNGKSTEKIFLVLRKKVK